LRHRYDLATLTDANSNVTTYEYDGLDRRLKARYPSPVTPGTSSATDYEQFSYDSNGNLTTLRTRRGQSVVLGYDSLNRVVSRSYPAVSFPVKATLLN
jgi:YD repeat-containing protein